MTNADLNKIHIKVFGVVGEVELLPEPIDTCDAQQLILGWLEYVFNSGTEREISIRYRSLGVNYALQKLLCNVPDIQESWRCSCDLPKPQFNQGNNVFPCVSTPFISPNEYDFFHDNHVMTYDPRVLPEPTKQDYSLLREEGDSCN